MEDEQLLSREDIWWMRWLWPMLSIYWLLTAARSMWAHGLRSWDWVQNAALGLMVLSPALSDWQARRREWRWQLRLLPLTWGTLLGLWIGHETGWVPGACIILVFALAATERKSGWWSGGIKKPLGILELSVAAVGLWFISTTKERAVFACVGAIILLLVSEKDGRRSMRENLLRFKSLAWVATFSLAFYWSWKEPSFASILAVVAIPVLWFGSLLMHLSSGERSLALPHPQS